MLGIDLSLATRRFLFLFLNFNFCWYLFNFSYFFLYNILPPIIIDFGFVMLLDILQKAPSSGELVIMGTDAKKPYFVLGVISGTRFDLK